MASETLPTDRPPYNPNPTLGNTDPHHLLNQRSAVDPHGAYGNINAQTLPLQPIAFKSPVTYGATSPLANASNALAIATASIPQSSYVTSWLHNGVTYYSQPNFQTPDTSWYDPYAYPMTCGPSSIYSHTYPNVFNPTAVPSLQFPPAQLEPVTTYQHDAHASYVSSILQQTIFFFDQMGRPALTDLNAETLRYAIRTAHRFVFSKKSLRILYRFYGYGTFYELRGNPHNVAALDTLTRCDGMSIVLDCDTPFSGLVRMDEPRVLRVNATLVKHASRARDRWSRRLHVLYLASVVAHLMCRSIQLLINGPQTDESWIWEQQFFGGRIERIMALPEGEGGARGGEIQQIVIAICDRHGPGWLNMTETNLYKLTEGRRDWHQGLTLRLYSGRIYRQEHCRLLRFYQVTKEADDEVEYHTPEPQISPLSRDAADAGNHQVVDT